MSVQVLLTKLLQEKAPGMLIALSQQVITHFFPKRSIQSGGKSLRKWTSEFLDNGCLKPTSS
jgi:hypothetical protein